VGLNVSPGGLGERYWAFVLRVTRCGSLLYANAKTLLERQVPPGFRRCKRCGEYTGESLLGGKGSVAAVPDADTVGSYNSEMISCVPS